MTFFSSDADVVLFRQIYAWQERSMNDLEVGQGCQALHFHTKKYQFGYFGRPLGYNMSVYIFNVLGIFYGHLVYFVAIWYILWSFGIFCGHLVYFVAIWYILWPFGIFCGQLVYFFTFLYIFSRFGIFFHVLVCCAKKSGNPEAD
jgi:hypothetical protein